LKRGTFGVRFRFDFDHQKRFAKPTLIKGMGKKGRITDNLTD
jgi:hypothetical protein